MHIRWCMRRIIALMNCIVILSGSYMQSNMINVKTYKKYQYRSHLNIMLSIVSIVIRTDMINEFIHPLLRQLIRT